MPSKTQQRAPKHRDPQYVRAQMAKPPVVEAAEEPQEEVIVAETQVQEAPTIADSMSAEVQAEIQAFLGDQGIEVQTSVPAEEATTEAIAEEKTKLKAEKTPKTPKEPKAATTPSRLQEGHCRVCGKSLTNESSVIRGIGPVCFNAMKRQFGWSDEVAKTKINPEQTSDAEWADLVEQIYRLLYRTDVPVTDVPEGYVEMSKWWREAEKHNLTVSAISKAVGGDRAVGTPLDERFQCVYVQVGNRARKFLPPEAMTEEAFAAIAASKKDRELTGAAKAAKVKADQKKQAAKKEESVGNVTKLADGSFS